MQKKSRTKPESGYSFESVVDALAVAGEESRCEVCGTRIRWVHLLSHPAYYELLAVGCDCAERLCAEYDGRASETNAKNRAGQLERFLNPKQWSRSSKGNMTRNVRGIQVTVYEKNGEWRYCIARKKQTAMFPYDPFTSERDAMVGAFDWIKQFA